MPNPLIYRRFGVILFYLIISITFFNFSYLRLMLYLVYCRNNFINFNTMKRKSLFLFALIVALLSLTNVHVSAEPVLVNLVRT